MKKCSINETEPKQDSLVYNAFKKIDYRDAFLISFKKNTFKSINDFAKKYFISQPAWLRVISMNTISKQKIEDSLKKSNLEIDSNIGSWKIFNKNDNEIVFGESMGFMDYRFSMRLDKNCTDDIEVSTVVTLNGSMGKYYFSVVKLMHKKFVKISLNNLIKT
ncbi:MAG: DUF2867 domain-containing protein [Proteobacteria bacterium]|nr:DUF2867 domain-containing protein [Pseudomonadota bacterium]MBU1582939.1 DUF2867 domain-containing protein [Pseudomonadota bacterium]MBU2451750.1 DUF2867 domain-containing protein [Pseudomonadota bacterium]MBU2629422.1 DUF2867 domain-containing protein [Pseudomonadota bacterium]